MIKIILLKKIKNLGEIGEIVVVNNGYALNYLLPLKKALSVFKNIKANDNKKDLHISREKVISHIIKKNDKKPIIIYKNIIYQKAPKTFIVEKDISKSFLSMFNIRIKPEDIEIQSSVTNLGYYDTLAVKLYKKISICIKILICSVS